MLVDNGRTELLANPETEEVLKCIRCGACLNICPIFRQVGGHTYGTIYPGPIGSIFTPRTAASASGDISPTRARSVLPAKECARSRSTYRNSCSSRRRDFIATGNVKPAERVGFAGFRWATAGAGRFRLMGWMGRKAISGCKCAGTLGNGARSHARVDKISQPHGAAETIIPRVVEGKWKP